MFRSWFSFLMANIREILALSVLFVATLFSCHVFGVYYVSIVLFVLSVGNIVLHIYVSYLIQLELHQQLDI